MAARWGGRPKRFGTGDSAPELSLDGGGISIFAIMSENEGYPEVDELTGIGSGLKDRLNENGYYTIFDVANAKDYELEEVKGVGVDKAGKLIEESKTILDDSYFTKREWNPVTGEYEDVEQDIFNCEYCDKPFNQKSVWNSHQQVCSENPSNG